MEIIDQTAKVVMLKGEGGDSIKSIDKTTTHGLVDVYTITLASGKKTTFSVTNGSNIASVEKTASSGLTDTYTITLTDGSKFSFNVTNGKGIKSIGKTGTSGLVDTYTITFDNEEKSTFTVTNGKNGENGKDGKDGAITNLDATLSTTSTNPVQNKAIAESINSIGEEITSLSEKIDTKLGSLDVDTELSTTSTNPVQNKAIANSINDVQRQIRTNLLNPTAQTQTINGVTLTNNGDGTYTVNGTANGRCAFRIGNITVKKDDYAKITGCPKNGSEGTYSLQGTNNVDYSLGSDIGSGHIFHNTSNYTEFYIYIIINSGTVCDSLLFKPMITTDLSATYDDFVPYTGDSGRLNEDVAALFKAISAIKKS